MSRARFYVIGPQFHGYTRSAAHALSQCGQIVECKELISGHDVSPIGVIRYYGNELVARFADMKARRHSQITEAIRRFCPQFLLIVKGDWLTAEQLQTLRSATHDVRVILWAQDSIANIPGIEQFADLVDLLAVFEPTDQQLQIAGAFPSVIHLPAAYDPQYYFPIASKSWVHDLTFVGAAYPRRREFLEHTGRLLAKSQFQMCIVGNYSRPDPLSRRRFRRSFPLTARSIRARALAPAMVNKLYSESLAVLNMHHEQSRRGFNPRTVEILASGRPQLLDRKHDLAALFPPDDCVLFYETPEDALQQVQRLATSPALRTHLSQNAIEFARPHSMESRMRQLLDFVQA